MLKMKFFRISLTLLCLFITTAISADTLKGTVKDAEGEPIIGATIIEKGTTNATTTDFNGEFSLNVSSKSHVIVSYVGMESQELNVRGKSNVNVVLKSTSFALDEVVAIGYGTARKTDLTGSATSLSPEALNVKVGANILEGIQGKAAGVSVLSNNLVGEAPTLRVRGSSSINAGTDPLLVVDGFPLVDADLNDINPQDVESMEILKDASSTAIYGSRGTNGVILITTKKGSRGRANVSAHANLGVQMRGRLVETISGQDFVNYINSAYAYKNNDIITGRDTRPFPNGYNGPFIDWQEETISKSALLQDYGVSVDGATDRTKYMVSFGYYNQDGLIKTNAFDKFMIHNNIEHKINDLITVGSSMQFTTSHKYRLSEVVTNDIFRCAWPTDPVYKEDGSYNILNHGEKFNSIASINAQTDRTKNIRFLGNFFGQLNFTKHLNYRLNVGYDIKDSHNYQFKSSQIPKRLDSGDPTSDGSQAWWRGRSVLVDNILTYTNLWNNVHRLTATAVYSWQDYKFNSSSMSGNFDNDELGAYKFDSATNLKQSSDIYSNKLMSWVGRASYAYADKYLLTATIRFDGSSRFGKDNKWATFPSIGAAWRVSQEKFMQNVKPISDLKVRLSYGVAGNQEIGNYKSLAQLATDPKLASYSDGYNTLTGYYESVGNDKLKWERTKEFDLGIDLGLFDRVNLTVDYYNRKTSDLLFQVPIPSTSGFSSVLSNVGEVNNKGLEIAVNAEVFRNSDWKVNVGANFTYNKNEITELYNGKDELLIQTGNTGLDQKLVVGESVNAIYARHSLGIIQDQATLDWYKSYVPNTAANAKLGEEMYEDVDGDGSITQKDYQSLGSAEPPYFYGFNVNVAWKKFTLDIYGQGAFKYASLAGAEDMYANNTKWAIGYQNTGSYCLWAENSVRDLMGLPSQYAYDRMWSETNPGGTFPRAGANGIYQSDRTNADWAYFILRNIQLGYDFSNLIPRNLFKEVKFTVNFQNFVTWANHRGYNPENGDVSNPFAKTILFGISAKF